MQLSDPDDEDSSGTGRGLWSNSVWESEAAMSYGEPTEWDLRDEAEEGDERHRERGSEREQGVFYSFSPPQETSSRELVDFDPRTCMDRGAPKHTEALPERHVFKAAMFYGHVTDCEWMDEDSMSAKLWKDREKLDIFIGKDMHDEEGPWLIFLVHRTHFGSRIEEMEIPKGQ